MRERYMCVMSVCICWFSCMYVQLLRPYEVFENSMMTTCVTGGRILYILNKAETYLINQVKNLDMERIYRHAI